MQQEILEMKAQIFDIIAEQEKLRAIDGQYEQHKRQLLGELSELIRNEKTQTEKEAVAD